jgi:hypothetical protein
MPAKLQSPDDVRSFLAQRFTRQHRAWLTQAEGQGNWPWSVGLGAPSEREVLESPGPARQWAAAWATWDAQRPAGVLRWVERRYALLGTQRWPEQLVLTSADEVAVLVGQARRWQRARARAARLQELFPLLAGTSALAGRFDEWADWADEDFDVLVSLLRWLHDNPASNLYLRQLPIEGLHTKWLEQRTGVVLPLLRALRPVRAELGLHELAGLRRPAHRVRMRLLDNLAGTGGLKDVEAPLLDLAELDLRPRAVIVVENLETGLALPPLPGAVAFMKLGLAAGVLGELPWLRDVPLVYWGDIDTHGLVILARMRRALPQTRSVLMDEATLLGNRPLWVREPAQYAGGDAGELTVAETELFVGLRDGRWGDAIRLEQERLPLLSAASTLEAALLGEKLGGSAATYL